MAFPFSSIHSNNSNTLSQKDKTHGIISELHQLVRWKQGDRALALLRKHQSDNLPINQQINHETLLHLAAQFNDENLMNYLILNFKDSLNLNAKDFAGETPLHRTCAQGNTKTTYLLLKYGAQVNVHCDRLRSTPAHHAAEIGSIPVLRLLQKFLGKLDAENAFGNRPIHRAAYHNHHKVVTFLVEEAGADPSKPNHDQQSPLYMAIVHGGMDSVLMLAGKFNADLESRVSTNYDRTMLHIAIHNQKEAIAQYLIHKGADVNAEDSQGRTPLHEAVAANNVELTRFILSQGASVDVRTNIELYTPLHLAAIGGNSEIMRMLIETSDATVNSVSQRNRVPLHYTCEKGHASCTRLLLESKAKRFIRDADGRYPMDLAQNTEVKRIFKEKMRWPSHLTVNIPETANTFTLRDSSPCQEMNLFPKEMMELQAKLLDSAACATKRNNRLSLTSSAATSSQLSTHSGKKKPPKAPVAQNTSLLSTALVTNPFASLENTDAQKRANTVNGKIAQKKHEQNRKDTFQQLQQLINMQQNMNPNVDASYYNDYLDQLQRESDDMAQKEQARIKKEKVSRWDPYFAFNKSPLGSKRNSTGSTSDGASTLVKKKRSSLR